MTIADAQRALSKKEISAVELVEKILSDIEKHKELNSYLEVFDDVLKQAGEADKHIAEGKAGSLAGIPLAIKDNILIQGRKVSAGSKILEPYTASYDAGVINNLKKEGAVLLGRTNMDEFAMGSSTEHSAFGIARNPHDLERVPGGSSGGSAAAVVSDAAIAALGSATGGSIRQPASFCGVVGLKPTYGTISRYGLIAMGSSLDQIGPITKTVEDAELLFAAVRGYDPNDSTSLKDQDFVAAPDKMRVGVPRHFLEKGLDKDVGMHFEETLNMLKEKGHEIVDVELPTVKYSLAVYYIIMPAEASANLARFDGVRYGLHMQADDVIGEYMESRSEGFGAEVKRRIMLGTYVLSAGYAEAYYGRATALRSQITEDFNRVFIASADGVDAIATPTTPTPAFKIGEKSDPLSMYLADIFTVPANLTGMPAISVPMGMVSRGDKDLPVGIQFTAPHLHENTLFSLGRSVEKI